MKTNLNNIKSFVSLYLPGIEQKIAMPDLKEIEQNAIRFTDFDSEQYDKVINKALSIRDETFFQQMYDEISSQPFQNICNENFVYHEYVEYNKQILLELEAKIKIIQKNKEELLQQISSEEIPKVINFLEKGINSSIYNISAILRMIDHVHSDMDEFIELLELKLYDDARILWVGMNETIILAESAITNFIVDMDTGTIMDFSLHHRLLPEWPYYLKVLRSLLTSFEVLAKKVEDNDDEHYFLLLYPICMDIMKARKKIDVLKFVLAFLCIIRSPEYSVSWKKYAYEMLKLYKEILYKGTLYKVFLQSGKLSGSDTERGSENRTTRLQFLFELSNNDVFSLRIYMSHKGVNYIHINLEEVYHGKIIPAGFPFTYQSEENETAKLLAGNQYETLFWNYEDRIWFKSNFRHQLKSAPIPEKNKEALNLLFEKQCHRKIEILFDETDIINFMKEINIYLKRFQLTNMIESELKKNDEKIINSLRNIYLFQDIYIHILDFLLKKSDNQIPLKKIIWELFEKMGLEKTHIPIKDFKNMDLNSILRLIDTYCL